ncbi:hypothetical protein CYY_006813, partial [Polysphondylium violaceum]
GTGATGKELVKELISSDKFSKITSLVRKIDTSLENEKLNQVVVDFEELDKYKDLFKDHQVGFNCLGTTIRVAKSAAAFRHIEYDYSESFTKLSKEAGIENMHLLTSQGANAKSWLLYTKTKGEIEERTKKEGFATLSIWRPGFLDRGRTDRTLENIMMMFLSRLSLPVSTLGKAMKNSAVAQLDEPIPTTPKVNIYYNKDVYNFAKLD